MNYCNDLNIDLKQGTRSLLISTRNSIFAYFCNREPHLGLVYTSEPDLYIDL